MRSEPKHVEPVVHAGVRYEAPHWQPPSPQRAAASAQRNADFMRDLEQVGRAGGELAPLPPHVEAALRDMMRAGAAERMRTAMRGGNPFGNVDLTDPAGILDAILDLDRLPAELAKRLSPDEVALAMAHLDQRRVQQRAAHAMMAGHLERAREQREPEPPAGGVVLAFDAATNRPLWRTQVYTTATDPSLERDVQDVFITSLAVAGDRLIVRDERRRIHQLDLATGRVLASELDTSLDRARASAGTLAPNEQKRIQRHVWDLVRALRDGHGYDGELQRLLDTLAPHAAFADRVQAVPANRDRDALGEWSVTVIERLPDRRPPVHFMAREAADAARRAAAMVGGDTPSISEAGGLDALERRARGQEARARAQDLLDARRPAEAYPLLEAAQAMLEGEKIGSVLLSKLMLTSSMLGRPAQVIAWAERVIAVDANNLAAGSAHHTAGLAAIILDRIDDARVHLERALAIRHALGRDTSDTQAHLAKLRFTAGEVDAAIAAVKALLPCPYRSVYLIYYQMLCYVGRHAEAADALEQGRTCSSAADVGTIDIALARLEADRGDAAKAWRHFEVGRTALRGHPSMACSLRAQEAWLEALRGNTARSRLLAGEAEAMLGPLEGTRSREVLVSLSRAYLAMRDGESALRILQARLDAGTESIDLPRVWLSMGDALVLLGRGEEARTWWQRAAGSALSGHAAALARERLQR